MNRKSNRLGAAVAATLATIALSAMSFAAAGATAGSHSVKINGGTLTCCRK